MGRRPVKVPVRRAHSRLLRHLGFRAKVDVVAQQVLDHDDGLFKAVRDNDLATTLRLMDEDPASLVLRDSVGAAPIHLAFLFGHYALGQAMVRKCPELATLVYTTLDHTGLVSPYEGENILHIAIVHRQRQLARWLVHEVPELVDAETIGSFFRPSKPCYFGGAPLLFALASDQIDIAVDILVAAERLERMPVAQRRRSEDNHLRYVGLKRAQMTKRGFLRNDMTQTTKLQASNAVAASVDVKDTAGLQLGQGEDAVKTSIFMCDSYGNNALHLAVIHDLPAVFDFAVAYAMRVLVSSDFSIAAVSELDPATLQEMTDDDCVDADEARMHQCRMASILGSQPERLVDFLRRVDDDAHKKMMAFLLQRNGDALTPLSLSAALGNQRMFKHILQHTSSVAWAYGPITAINIPLRELEEPEPTPELRRGRLQVVYDVLDTLPYPLAVKGTTGYMTAIQCICSFEVLSSTIHTSQFSSVLEKRLELLNLVEVKQLLHKKWKYVGKRRFMTRFLLYEIFLFTFNLSTLFANNTYSDPNCPLWKQILLGLCEIVCLGFAVTRFFNEFHQLVFNFRAYVTEVGAGRLDNICTLTTTVFMFLSVAMRATNNEDLTDAFAAIALVFAWFYQFFFLLGFRTTGPFVIMILNMISNDVVRFLYVYIAVMAGFSQALYLVQDGRQGFHTLMSRVRRLLIAGFTGEVNYDDNYTSGRMNPLTQILMFGYVILVMILLVNLLIAMMGNTYSEILAKSEQRWVAERANIMTTIENQCPARQNELSRKKYGISMASRHGQPEMFLQLEINDAEKWKTRQTENPSEF